MNTSMKYKTESVTMWFDRRLVVRSSPIHGYGLFATEPISAGEELIWVTGGIVYSTEDWKTGKVKLAPELYNETQIDDDLFVATPKSLFYYVNHSCDPNFIGRMAWRDIEANEELTTDFATFQPFSEYLLEPCNCGSSNCRGRMTGNDWQLPELQKRYRGHFTPHIERLIHGSNNTKK